MADDPTQTQHEAPRLFTLRVYYMRPDDPPIEERFWNPAAAWARYHELKASDPSITRGVVIAARVGEPGDEGLTAQPTPSA